MSVWEYIIGAVLIVFSLVIIAIVLLQEGRQANLGAICGCGGFVYGKGQGEDIGCGPGKVDEVYCLLLLCAGVRRDAADKISVKTIEDQRPARKSGAFFENRTRLSGLEWCMIWQNRKPIKRRWANGRRTAMGI